MVHHGPVVVRTEGRRGATACSPELIGAWPPATLEHGSSPAREQKGEGAQGTCLGSHRSTSSGVAVGQR
jgi:hypothetical protein